MRALFTTDQQIGHFRPLVPIARALEAMGHLVAFASLPDLAWTIEACGFRFLPIRPGARELPDLIAWCEEWNPDVIVTANSASAGAIAAERRQIPYADVKAGELSAFDAEGNGLPSPAVIIGVLEQLVTKRQSHRADSRNL
jgi:UDP:flavonoid glycosyltransferase YjiC (YdhE family)